MSDLTQSEKRKLERLLGMGSGYVLDFSNRTFSDFVQESIRREIYDPKYDHGSGSKANRLRGLWNAEGNATVGKLMSDIMDYAAEGANLAIDKPLLFECRKIVTRLSQSGPVQELDSLAAPIDSRDFEAIASAVREAISRNEPEAALDRLHTFVIKYVRSLCEERGLFAPRDKPLHSQFGEYVKNLRESGHIESTMTERILKSSISVLEAFNDVRNNQSLAHDNKMLNYEEALLIFNHVAGSIRFLRELEGRIRSRVVKPAPVEYDDDIPF
jgi:hypothetical protein